MNLLKLKYFKAVCDYGKVSSAASHLHISQPSLSNAIKELENEFGITLFSRQYSGMLLTNEGKTLLKLANDLLTHAEQVEHIISDMGNERKALRLGIPPMIGSMVLPAIYKNFNKLHSDISLEITEGGRDELLTKLNDDYLDMIFMPHKSYIDKNLSTMHLSKLEIVCCMSENNKLSRKKCLTQHELKDIPLVLFNDSFFQTEQIKSWFKTKNITPQIMMQTGQLSTIQTLVSNNIAVGFMFKEIIKSNTDIMYLPTSEPMYADISLVWKKDAYMLACMKEFINFMSKLDIFNN